MPVSKKDREESIKKVKKIVNRTYFGDIILDEVRKALESMEKRGELCVIEKGKYFFIDGRIKKSKLLSAIKKGVMASLYKGGIYKKGSFYLCKNHEELKDEEEDDDGMSIF